MSWVEWKDISNWTTRQKGSERDEEKKEKKQKKPEANNLMYRVVY